MTWLSKSSFCWRLSWRSCRKPVAILYRQSTGECCLISWIKSNVIVDLDFTDMKLNSLCEALDPEPPAQMHTFTYRRSRKLYSQSSWLSVEAAANICESFCSQNQAVTCMRIFALQNVTILAPCCVCLTIPSLLGGGKQMPAGNAVKTKKIAHLRVHMELMVMRQPERILAHREAPPNNTSPTTRRYSRMNTKKIAQSCQSTSGNSSAQADATNQSINKINIEHKHTSFSAQYALHLLENSQRCTQCCSLDFNQ